MITLPVYLKNLIPDNNHLFPADRGDCRYPLLSCLKRRASFFILIGSMQIFLQVPLEAQIYKCGDTWTNRPCDSAEVELVETKSTPASEDESTRAKRDAVHQLVSARYAAMEKFGVSIDTGEVERLCESPATSLDDCRKAISEYHNRLDSRVIEQQKIDLKRREVELAEQKSIDDAGEDHNQVVVIQQGVFPTRTPYWSRPPWRTPGNARTPEPWVTPEQLPAPSRNEVPNDARGPAFHPDRPRGR